MHQAAADWNETLADGAVARWALPTDIAGIEAVYGTVFGDPSTGEFNQHIVGYVRGLLGGTHPYGALADVAIVVTAVGEVAAAVVLMRMPLAYGSVTYDAGRPELVVCREAYRGRGYVAALFSLIHARSAQRGDLIQLVSGIPYYFRNYGYSYALPLGGSKIYPLDVLPSLPTGSTEPYAFRRATPADIPVLMALATSDTLRGAPPQPLVSQVVWERGYWEYVMSDAAAQDTWFPWVAVSPDGEVVGSVGIGRFRYHEQLEFYYCFTHEFVEMRAFAGALVRFLMAHGATLAHAAPGVAPFTAIRANLGEGHAFHTALRMLPQRDEAPYAWFVRVPDYVALLTLLAPVLSERLRHSPWRGFRGAINVSLYRGGFTLCIADGRVSATAYESTAPVHASYPPEAFAQQLFGMRSLAALRAAHMDVRVQPEAADILQAVFPGQAAWVPPLD